MLDNSESKIGAVILAAGHGKRMKSEIPKVMTAFKDRPLVDYVVESVEKSGCCIKPIAVVCKDHTLVQDYLKDRADYVIQEKQLGTGHAVRAAESELKDKAEHVVVLYGDMPFVKAESIKRLVERHLERNNTLTLMTATVQDFEDWRALFKNFGRIVRREDGHIARIVEKKDATEEEIKIKEVNPSYFCINADWMWKNLRKLKNENVQGEYYLTDLVQLAIESGKISSIDIDPEEVLGINTQEDLKLAEQMRGKL